MKSRFFIIAIFWVKISFTQNLSAVFSGGLINYQGDLQDRGYTLDQAHAAIGFGIFYQVSGRIEIGTTATFGNISGNDKTQKRNTIRNFNFSSPINDFSFVIHGYLINLNKYNFSPYFITGLSYFHFNPFTYDISGKKVYLQPLSTEGQGFYNNRKVYNLHQFAIPLGAGLKYNLWDKCYFSVEIAFRKTNTDYLDDVSTTYVDKNLLLAIKGPQAVALAFRSNEIDPTLQYPSGGSQRGNAKLDDWYYFTTVGLGINLFDKKNKKINANNSNNKKYLNQVRCPAF